MPAGYSGTPLAKKLGIKPGMRVVARGAPADYRELLVPLPDEARIVNRLDGSALFIHQFVDRRSALERALPRLVERLDKQGVLWISWPKRASGVATDLDSNVVRTLGLAAGLVDVKVCAVDDVWSGLKFVYRLRDR